MAASSTDALHEPVVFSCGKMLVKIPEGFHNPLSRVGVILSAVRRILEPKAGKVCHELMAAEDVGEPRSVPLIAPAKPVAEVEEVSPQGGQTKGVQTRKEEVVIYVEIPHTGLIHALQGTEV